MRFNKPLRLFTIWDIFLLILLVALVGLTLYFSLTPKPGQYVEIYVDGDRLKSAIPLSENAVIELEGLTVVVSEGKVYVQDADCPDKLCEKTGEIKKAGESIICLPNRVVIKISGKAEVEAIT